MKVWISLNATLDLEFEDDKRVYEAIREVCAEAIKSDSFSTITFKSGIDNESQT